jgi:hypothetical protein
MSTAAPLEIVEDDQKELLAVAAQNGLLPETTQNLQSTFAPLFKQARSVLEKSRSIHVTDVSQKLEIKLARTLRLELRAIRVASDKTRKELKEESLKKGKAIDGFHNILLHLVEAEERRLDEQEQFAERLEAERKAALKAEREEMLKPYSIDTAVFSLGDMTEDTFNQLLSGTKLAHEAKIEAARKAEADRIAAEQAHLAEQARIKAENERLKKEAEEKEAALAAERAAAAAERAKQEVALKAERERVAAEQAAERARVTKEQAEAAAAAKAELDRREALAAEERKKQEAAAAEIRRVAADQAAKAEADRKAQEEAARKERERLQAIADSERAAREKLEAEQAAAKKAADDAARKAAAAPDKEKLRAFAEALWGMTLPELTTPAGIAVMTVLKSQHEKYIAWVTKQGEAL